MISTLIEFLTAYFHQGDANGMVLVARNILGVIPDDLVALQFMALAFLQLGRKDLAFSLFRKASEVSEKIENQEATGDVCELAASVSYREATKQDSELSRGWYMIAVALKEFDFNRLSARALQASLKSHRVSDDPY